MSLSPQLTDHTPDGLRVVRVDVQVQLLLRRLDRRAPPPLERYVARQAHERATVIAERLVRRVRELTDRWTG